MNIIIPDRKEIFKGSISVSIAPRGESWSQSCLGDMAIEKGVYIILYRNSIQYIGKTNGPTMSFGMRLRRHFQETAAGNKHTYPKLERLHFPPSIKVKMIPLYEIKNCISHNLNNVNEYELIPLFEAALILAYKPKFQC